MEVKANMKNLSKDDLATLAVLSEKSGIKFLQSASPKKGTVLLDEYFKHYIFTCSTCGSTQHEYFHMKRHPHDSSVLWGMPVTIQEIEAPAKLEKHSLAKCGACKEFLLTLSKEELVEKIYKLIR